MPHLRDSLTVAKAGSYAVTPPFWLSFPRGIRDPFARRSTLVAGLLLSTIPTHAQAAPNRKLFTSPEDGIAFTYPAPWLLNADDDAATAKLRLSEYAQPHAVVQLEGNFAGKDPYAGTDFEAGAFAYTIVEADPPTCLATLDPLAKGADKPTSLTWHTLPARRLQATFTVAGTDDIHTILAVAEPARCLLFETVLIRKSVGLDIKPLTPEHWAFLRARFNAVLASVRLAPVSASSAASRRGPSPP